MWLGVWSLGFRGFTRNGLRESFGDAVFPFVGFGVYGLVFWVAMFPVMRTILSRDYSRGY